MSSPEATFSVFPVNPTFIKTDLEFAAAMRQNFILALRLEIQRARTDLRAPSNKRVGKTLGVDRHTVSRRKLKYKLSFTSIEVTGIEVVSGNP